MRLHEPVENAIATFDRNADTVVANRQHGCTRATHPQGELDGRVTGAEFEGVVDQVRQRLLDTLRGDRRFAALDLPQQQLGRCAQLVRGDRDHVVDLPDLLFESREAGAIRNLDSHTAGNFGRNFHRGAVVPIWRLAREQQHADRSASLLQWRTHHRPGAQPREVRVAPPAHVAVRCAAIGRNLRNPAQRPVRRVGQRTLGRTLEDAGRGESGQDLAAASIAMLERDRAQVAIRLRQRQHTPVGQRWHQKRRSAAQHAVQVRRPDQSTAGLDQQRHRVRWEPRRLLAAPPARVGDAWAHGGEYSRPSTPGTIPHVGEVTIGRSADFRSANPPS